MENIHYDDFAKVEIDGEIYNLFNVSKKSKTRTVSKGIFKAVIKVDDIKVSPKTYWKISGYDHQFDGNDANCYLCGWYGMDYGKCKCKPHFTVEEHVINIPIARRNFVKTVLSNYFKGYLPCVEGLSDEQINKLLYKSGKHGCRMLHLDLPHWSNRDKEVARMLEHLQKFFKI